MIQAISFPLECSPFGYPGFTLDNIDLDVIFITFNGVFRSTMTFIFEVCLITRRSIIRSSRRIFAIFGWFLLSLQELLFAFVGSLLFLLLLELLDMSGTLLIFIQCLKTTFSIEIGSSGRSTCIVYVIEFIEIILNMYSVGH